MSMSARVLLIALAAAVAAPAAAQPGGRHPERPRAMEALSPEDGRAFEVLLRHREQLRLTDVQVRRIQEIGRGLEARNAPLRRRLAEERQRWMARRQAELERMDAEQRRHEMRRMRQERRVPEPMQPLMREMRQNIADAVRDAHGVLSDEQRTRARRVLREEARARHEQMRARHPEMRRRPLREGRPPRPRGEAAPRPP
ncbi:hypothetical protein [Longimicrobium sp.]|uniref:hypothetical protein n=1 Tax=Longimicrobium sp. TaxID=2029185 RepID=UPI002F92A29F